MFRQFVSTLAFLSLAAITLALPASAQEFLAETMPGEVVLAPEGEYLLESPAMMGPEACCAPLGQAYDVFAPCHFPRWFGHAENLWLKRDTGDNLVFVTGINNGNVFALGTRELMFDHEPGLRTSIGYALNCHTYIEASYFGLFDWNAVNQINAGGNIGLIAGASGLLTGITSQQVGYSSSLHSAELNLRTYVHVYPHLSVLIGARYIHYDEDFAATETGDIGGVPSVAFLQKATNNNAIGAHIGADTTYMIGEWLGIGITSRLGLLSNQSESRVFRSATASPVGPISVRTSEDGTDITFSTEIAAVMTVQVTNNLAIRGGYQLLYLSGLALGPEQLVPDFGAAQTLNDDSDLLFHGPFVGVILQWGSCD